MAAKTRVSFGFDFSGEGCTFVSGSTRAPPQLKPSPRDEDFLKAADNRLQRDRYRDWLEGLGGVWLIHRNVISN